MPTLIFYISLLCLTALSNLVVAQEEAPIRTEDREHWSFAPLRVPDVPTLSSEWTRSPIDAFIEQKMRAADVHPTAEADKRTLLRRLAFDLTGLPPEADALRRLSEHAEMPDAYEREVDRMLASPASGEHLAQSWLDLARYAESDGFEHDKVRPDAWRYRDWVVQSINDDMPYDRFMRLQVAGDLIEDEPDGAMATMFCLSGTDMPDLNNQDERRHDLLNEMTGTVGSVLLGLQLGCAACHDHKYDPLSQADFYRLRAVLATGVPELVRDKPWTSLKEQTPAVPAMFYHRGDFRQPVVELKPGLPRIAAASDQPESQLITTAAHPRLVLADWLASGSNPLPARVVVNRLWQSHFGRGLSTTPGDVGVVGVDPTHPQLLDWLASELRRSDWSVQRLRRQIVLSAVYRAQSLGESAENDAENQWLSRYPRRRLTGEMLRDAMLSVSGQLNRQSSGPSAMPPLPPELMQTLLPGQWKASKNPADHARRSIYIFARRNLRYPIFESFDRPDAGASCPQRGQSVTATQSLLMFNSEFSVQTAQAVADRVMTASAAEQTEKLWQVTLQRSPSQTECQLLEQLLARFEERRAGLQAAALGLLNSNEFVIVD